MSWPAVVVVSRRTTRKNKLIDYVGEAHLKLLVNLRILPLVVPVVEGTADSLPQFMQQMRGLLLVEGEDIEPKHFRSTQANFRHLEKTHPLKDELEIRLLRAALRRKIPILGICRGSQLLNVVSGGTLYGDVQKEKKSRLKHIDYAHYDTYRHSIKVVHATPLEHWYRRRTLHVNSYHHQGILRLASKFKPMAVADDGLVEAYYDPQAEFVVGVQFHPERMGEERSGNARLWKAFAAAVKRKARLKARG